MTGISNNPRHLEPDREANKVKFERKKVQDYFGAPVSREFIKRAMLITDEFPRIAPNASADESKRPSLVQDRVGLLEDRDSEKFAYRAFTVFQLVFLKMVNDFNLFDDKLITKRVSAVDATENEVDCVMSVDGRQTINDQLTEVGLCVKFELSSDLDRAINESNQIVNKGAKGSETKLFYYEDQESGELQAGFKAPKVMVSINRDLANRFLSSWAYSRSDISRISFKESVLFLSVLLQLISQLTVIVRQYEANGGKPDSEFILKVKILLEHLEDIRDDINSNPATLGKVDSVKAFISEQASAENADYVIDDYLIKGIHERTGN